MSTPNENSIFFESLTWVTQEEFVNIYNEVKAMEQMKMYSCKCKIDSLKNTVNYGMAKREVLTKGNEGKNK